MGSIECGGVLFDLDGVLVDSTPGVTRVWRGWAIEHGYDPARIVKLAHGRRAIETVELVAPHLDSAAELVELERRELDDTDGLVVFEGAARLLTALPSVCWTVVTSGTRRLATKRLRLGGLAGPGKDGFSRRGTARKAGPRAFFAWRRVARPAPAGLRCRRRRSFRSRVRAPGGDDGFCHTHNLLTAGAERCGRAAGTP